MLDGLYSAGPCSKRLVTREEDLDRNDFKVSVSASEDAPGEFDVVVTIAKKDFWTDVDTFVTAGNATIYSDDAPETIIGTDAGPNTDGAPDNLQFTFEDVVQTVGNTGNTWTIVIPNLEITSKDGASHTIASITKTFPSPL